MGGTVSMAFWIAVSRASRVRALAARKAVLTWLKHSSIGDKSGEYGGK